MEPPQPKLLKLTKKEKRDKEIELANLELDNAMASLKVKHFRKRLSSGLIEKEAISQIESLKEQIKNSDPKSYRKATENALKQLEHALTLSTRNIKALKEQIRTGVQPHFG